MPKYTTTAKDVTAPFTKRTTDLVTVAGVDMTLYFRKGDKSAGERVTGWYASAAGTEAHGKTLDDAADAAIAAREEIERKATAQLADMIDATEAKRAAAEKAEGSGDAPKGERKGKGRKSAPKGGDVKAEESGKGEESAPKLSGSKVSALVMAAYRRSSEAVSAFMAGKVSRDDAQMISSEASAQVAEDVSRADIPAHVAERLHGYAITMIHHHLAVIMGDNDRKLSKGQSSRARRKLAAVAASLV